MFDEIERITINPGKTVICDNCSKDYTNLDDKGGFLFSNNAICPTCAPDYRNDVIQLGEEKLITVECPYHMPFREFVYQIRYWGVK